MEADFSQSKWSKRESKWTKTKLQCLHKLISEIIYYHFCHILLLTQTPWSSVGKEYSGAQMPRGRDPWGPYCSLGSKVSDLVPSCFLEKSDQISLFKAVIFKRGWRGIELEKHVLYYIEFYIFFIFWCKKTYCFLNMGYRKLNLTMFLCLWGYTYMHISDDLREK